MRRWYQSKTPFEKRYKAIGRSGGGTWAQSVLYLLTSTVFKFPARNYFKSDRQIDSIYLELSAYCLFSSDFYAATEIPDDYSEKEQVRRVSFDFNFMVMEELWNRSSLIAEIIDDRMAFYGAAASNPEGWPVAETAMNLYLSATTSVDRRFGHAATLPPIDPKCLELGISWTRWATLVKRKVPECHRVLYS